MKKSTLLIAGLLALGSTSMHADEGMWTLYNLPDAVYEQMVAEGFQLPRNMLYGAPNAISNSVINFLSNLLYIVFFISNCIYNLQI